MSLDEYRRKRDPRRTPEPSGRGKGGGTGDAPLFVVQRHDARRLHYDLRLEMDGVLASWALPKGLPLETGERYLAVHTEDHPMEYATFSGVIPKGEYGAGTMEIWDHGTYELLERKRDGGLTVRLAGERLHGVWTLVPATLGGDRKNWLVLRKHDEAEAPAPAAAHRSYTPMLASLTERLPSGDGWTFEVKWDGYRAIARLEGGEATLTSRRGIDLGRRFDAVRRALPHALRTSDCVVDGELCMLDDAGRPSFGLVQRGEGTPVYYVFDLLELERRPLTELPLEERKRMLQELLIEGNGTVRLSAGFADGHALLDAITAQGLEGVIAKRLASPYRPGKRTQDWLKLKTRDDGEFLIAGWTAGLGSREQLGALVLAEQGEDGLRWVGNVGSGLDERAIAVLLRDLGRLETTTPTITPVPKMPKTPARLVRWAEPRLRAKVRFAERTRDGRLRAPVFAGLAEQDAEGPPASRVVLSNPDKVFFPGEGITKGDVFAYYEAIAPTVVPHMRDRPFTMLRHPDGIAGKSFFQKDAPSHMPDWIETFTHEGIRYALVNDADSLLWMVNMGCIDLHPWLARRDRPDRPDLLMFDLDPAEGTPFSDVVRAALLVREALDALKLEGVPRTSGGKGIHVLVPVERRYEHREARGFVAAVAKALAQTHPDLITTKWRKAERHGVLVDANQNGLGRTTAGAYSVRPRPGATVATPLRWDELTPDLHPSAFTMDAVVERVRRIGDVAAPLLGRRQRLP
jgi:bifunctional non-homologous end joining protein LigD